MPIATTVEHRLLFLHVSSHHQTFPGGQMQTPVIFQNLKLIYMKFIVKQVHLITVKIQGIESFPAPLPGLTSLNVMAFCF